MANRPEPEIEITQDLVQALLADQCPARAHLELRELSRGWDNTNWRLGDQEIVRVPHRKVAADLIRNEQAWLPVLQQQIELPIPAPTHAGEPTSFYPWAWTVTPYFDGDEAASAQDLDQGRAARTLATFFRNLHTPAPDNPPTNQFRGCPLVDRATSFSTNLERLGQGFDRAQMQSVFDTACAVEPSTENVWLHGDLHARNMIIRSGDLAAVIDWGDICSGDRATDLAGAFMLTPAHIDVVKAHSGADDTAWQRARGWAMNFAVVYLAHSDDDPVMGAIGRQLVDVLTAN